MNKDKASVEKIGASRGRSTPRQGKFRLKWEITFEILDFYYDINHNDETQVFVSV